MLARPVVIPLLLVALGCATAGQENGGEQLSRPRTSNAAVLDSLEIAAAPQLNMLEAIRAHRPQWLSDPRTLSGRTHARDVRLGADMSTRFRRITVTVLLDETVLGDLASLETVPAAIIAEARFFAPAAAVARFGTRFEGGVIYLRTYGARQP